MILLRLMIHQMMNWTISKTILSVRVILYSLKTPTRIMITKLLSLIIHQMMKLTISPYDLSFMTELNRHSRTSVILEDFGHSKILCLRSLKVWDILCLNLAIGFFFHIWQYKNITNDVVWSISHHTHYFDHYIDLTSTE